VGLAELRYGRMLMLQSTLKELRIEFAECLIEFVPVVVAIVIFAGTMLAFIWVASLISPGCGM